MDKSTFHSIAKIGSGTKRKNRQINLLEVAEEMSRLYSQQNSLDKVGKLVKLSPEMVRQFLKLNDLHEAVKNLIKVGSITSVDVGYRISKLEEKEQEIIARHVVKRNLSSDDVRAIVKFKIDNPLVPIEVATDKVIKSKNKNVYVAYLGIRESTFKELCGRNKTKDVATSVRRIFDVFIPKKSIVSFELNGRVVVIKVLKDGLQKMREKAKFWKAPLADLADISIAKHLEGRNSGVNKS